MTDITPWYESGMDDVKDLNGTRILHDLREALAACDIDAAASCPAGDETPAAVLVPILPEGLDGKGEPTVLFTKRTEKLANHAGQISFPGGRIETGDCDPVDAALRESDEEIGLPRDAVEVLGVLEPRSTRTGFVITPVIGVIEAPFVPVPDPGEVAAVFDVPLAFLMDTGNHERITFERDGQIRKSWAMPFDGHNIWGATAGILRSLSELLHADG